MKREYWDTDTEIERWNVGRKELNKYIKKFNKWDENKNVLKGISLILKLENRLGKDDDDWDHVYKSMIDDILENEDIDNTLDMLCKIRKGIYTIY